MKIGLIAIAGVKIQTRKFIELGVTLPQFVNRGEVVARLPSLALLTLAGATPREAGEIDLEYLEVDDVDAFTSDPKLDFDLVALSTYTARTFDAYAVADAYRSRGVPVVFGGLHASVVPGEAALHADAVVVGEGETVWPELVRDFQRKGRAGLKPVYWARRPGGFDLGEAPMPCFDLLLRETERRANTGTEGRADTELTRGANTPPDQRANAGTERRSNTEPEMRETGQIGRFGPYNRITVQTSRGCPWDCEFCAASKLLGPRYRVKPVERVLEEVDLIRSLWRRPFIEFADDNTFVNKAWSRRLLHELAGRQVRYFTETDISLAYDDELLDLLYPSGCRQVLIGFESPVRAGLEGIDRDNWKARQHGRAMEAIERIQSRGVSVCGCFIVGLDTDTPAIFDELREFIDRSRLLEVQITVLTAFPGTRLYRRLLAEGRLLHPGAWDRCTMFDVNFRPLRMSIEELEEGLMRLWSEEGNAEAYARRKRYYRQLLGARKGRSAGMAEAGDEPEEEEHYAFPPAHPVA